MVRRWRIRSRVFAVALVPASALAVVVGFDLHRTAWTIAFAGSATIVALALAFVVERSVTQPLRHLARLAADRSAYARADGSGPPADDLVATRHMRPGGELADLAIAVADGRRAAVDVISEQRSARRNLGDLVGSVAMRNEQLLATALGLLDDVARHDHDAATSDAIARVHRLVARVDRAAAAELVLLGRTSAVVREAATVTETVWAAALAIESSDRVDALSFPPARIAASAVGDVAHLLGELLDNAVRASAPGGRVTVAGESMPDGGFVVSILDSGYGLGPLDLATANRRVRRVDPMERIPASGVGLDVVGRIARRHGIEVELHRSSGGGTAATVRLPAGIVEAAPAEAFVHAFEPDPVVDVDADATDERGGAADVDAPVVAADVPESVLAADAVEPDLTGDMPEPEVVVDEAEPVLAADVAEPFGSGMVVDLTAAESRSSARDTTTPDDLLPRRQPKWAAAIAARSRS